MIKRMARRLNSAIPKTIKRVRKPLVVITLIVLVVFLLFFVYGFFANLNQKMEKNQNAVLVALLLLPLSAGVLRWWVGRSKKTTTTRTPNPEKWKRTKELWEKINRKENWRVLVGVAGCHGLVWYFWPAWYWTLAHSRLFWLDHLFLAGIFIFFSDEKRTRTGKSRELTSLGSFLLLLLAVGNAGNIYTWWNANKTSASASTTNIGTRNFGNHGVSAMSPTANLVELEETKKFLEGKNLTKQEYDEMLEIPHRESDYRQFESDGVTPLHGRINPKDTGRYQINSGWWAKEMAQPETPEEVKNLDIKTADGNMEAALYLYQKHGAKIWNSTGGMVLTENTYIIIAPVDGWSEEVPTPDLSRFPKITYDGDVTILTSENRTIPDGPGLRTDVGKPKWLRFQSRTGKSVTVFITPFK